MRKSIQLFTVVFLTFFLYQPSFAQDSEGGVQGWKVAAKKIGEGKFELQFSTTVKKGWLVYAPGQNLLEGNTTELQFTDSSIVLEGGLVATASPKEITSTIFENTKVRVYDNNAAWKAVINIHGTIPAKLQGTMLYTYGNNEGVYPSTIFSFVVALEGGVESTARIKIPSINIRKPVSDCGDEGTAGKSILAIFLLGFAGGLIALITPCVFPMIPVTVTFFTKKSESKKHGIRNAMLYGFFIFLIYVLITIPFHIASSTRSEIFNNISTSVPLNLIFFSVFVIFALSFFGLFEIGLPSGLANKADSKSGIGNVAGIFFMAGTLAIVSFSCTGPILGTLLANVADNGAWPLTAGAAGFGLALGLPFALFAMFPNWLQSLPKSGGWMTEVKVVLGFVELALAVKFLSNADLVKQWGILKREIFIGSWVIIGFCIVIYLSRKLWVKQASPRKRFPFVRVLAILLFLGMTGYIVPGLSNTKMANLKWISGFPPPLCYSIYKDPVNCMTGFKPLTDYETALAKAKAENKPLLIDFTGWACVNCRKMEESVWTDPTVDSLMHKEFVVVSLYVDERRKLPVQEQIVFTTKNGLQKSLVTVGDKWATFQDENFGATSQPQYVILSKDEMALTKPKYYPTTPKKFADWLVCGLETFRKKLAIDNRQ